LVSIERLVGESIMYQLPLLGSGAQGLGKATGLGRADDNAGPSALLAGDDGSLAGFSGDLQALLMQLSPQMLQRLEELLTGGMDLPQAARSLLGEFGGGSADGVFADFLQQRLPRADAALVPDMRVAGDAEAALVGQLAAARDAAGLPGDLVGSAATLPAFAALHAAAQGTSMSHVPNQLTGSLLDMGVPQQVGTRGWDTAIADRLMWMLQGDQQMARLKLNPPNLGPLEVRLSVHQDQASVSFLAPHAAVREALEAALPRLREMFDQQSLQLVRADVADPGAQRGDRAEDSGPRGSRRLDRWGGDSDAPEEVAATSPAVIGRGLVDVFA